jgi:hypothetical protein
VRKLLAMSMTTGTTSNHNTTTITKGRRSRFNLNFKKKSPFRAGNRQSGMTRGFLHGSNSDYS